MDRFDHNQADRGYTSSSGGKLADPNDARISPSAMLRRQITRLVDELGPAEREGLIKALLEQECRRDSEGRRDAAPNTTRPSQVEARVTVHSVLDQQMNEIGDLHNALQELDARLHTMLQRPPTDGAGQTGNSPSPVMVVDRLFMHNQGIRSATSIVQRFLQQVDL